MTLSLAALLCTGSVGTASAAKTTNTKKVAPRRENSCRATEKAIVFYRTQTWRSQDKLQKEHTQTQYQEKLKGACAYKKYVANLWRKRAIKAKNDVSSWNYQYAWWQWMPEKWQRVGACETGYGKRPGNFRWNSGTFQGFVGFYYGTWDAYRPRGFPSEAYLATPRQQMIVAEIVREHHGYGAWGCGGQ